ncbi:MAG TPA: bifunctional demethylmenaquinone methyltransferase/2-methoxy-6-polyprenyl-1,4-benzoquinol methylase UbiE [Pirellulaceae bacterium]
MPETPLDKSKERVQRMFASIAHRYDLMNHVLSLNIDRRWRARMVRDVFPTRSGPILDLCTGTGDLALLYWKETHGRFPIVGADFCPEMLAHARRKAQRLGAGAAIEWLEADALALPFPDDHFQLVTVAFGVRNLADTEAGLREVVRVCQPGGSVGILEFSLPTWQPFRGVYRWYFRAVLPRLGQWLARNPESAYRYLPSSVAEFPYGDVFAVLLRRVGLTSVTYRPLTGGITTLYMGRKPAVGDRPGSDRLPGAGPA